MPETVYQVLQHLDLQHQLNMGGQSPSYLLKGAFNMRKLLAKDIAPFTKILAKMELKDVIKSVFSNSKKERGSVTAELVYGIIENYYKAENDFLKFLSNIDGRSPEELGNLTIAEFADVLKELFDGENLDFFKSAAK
jgi:hypothetical protein